jgi:hypothetical protein
MHSKSNCSHIFDRCFRHVEPVFFIASAVAVMCLCASGSLANAVVSAPYFQVRCNFGSTTAPTFFAPTQQEMPQSCSAELALCTKSSEPNCQDRGTVTCVTHESHNSPIAIRFDGRFSREVKGNKIILTGVVPPSDSTAIVPRLTLGPAKTLPKPGRPVLSDSVLEVPADSTGILGECAVRLVQ